MCYMLAVLLRCCACSLYTPTFFPPESTTMQTHKLPVLLASEAQQVRRIVFIVTKTLMCMHLELCRRPAALCSQLVPLKCIVHSASPQLYDQGYKAILQNLLGQACHTDRLHIFDNAAGQILSCCHACNFCTCLVFQLPLPHVCQSQSGFLARYVQA